MENHPDNLRLNDANRRIEESVERQLDRLEPGSNEWIEAKIAEQPNGGLAKLVTRVDQPDWKG